MLLDVILHVDLVVVGGQWQLDPTKGYIVMGVYHLLSTTSQTIHSTLSDILCHKKAHLKVIVFTLYLLHNMIPTKYNFFPAQNPSTKLPIMGGECGAVESADHHFLECPFFDSVRHLIRKLDWYVLGKFTLYAGSLYSF